MAQATWTDEDKVKYREGTKAFAEQMHMTLDALLNEGFTRNEALPLLHSCIINQHRHEHFYDLPVGDIVGSVMESMEAPSDGRPDNPSE